MQIQRKIETHARLSGMNERLMIYGARQLMLSSEIEAAEAALFSEADPDVARDRRVALDAARSEMRA